MRLLLTSNGLTSIKLISEFKALLTKPASEIKVLMITTGPEVPDAKRAKKIMGYVLDFEKPLIKAGVLKNNFTVLFMSNPITVSFSNFDVIFICGGNTYLYLYLIRKLGLYDVLKKFIENGGLYVGVSAGSILAGPNIESAGIGRNRGNQIVPGLNDLTGLGLVKFTILPHSNEENRTGVIDEIKKAKLAYPCYTLKDGEGFIVLDNKVTKVM